MGLGRWGRFVGRGGGGRGGCGGGGLGGGLWMGGEVGVLVLSPWFAVTFCFWFFWFVCLRWDDGQWMVVEETRSGLER